MNYDNMDLIQLKKLVNKEPLSVALFSKLEEITRFYENLSEVLSSFNLATYDNETLKQQLSLHLNLDVIQDSF